MSEYTSDVSDDDLESLLTSMSKEVYKNADYKKGKNGKLTMTTTLDKETFDEAFEAFLSSMTKSLKKSLESQGIEAKNIRHGDCELTITVRDGYVQEYEMEFTIKLDYGSQVISVGVNLDIEINNPGQEGTVKLPTGCKDWEEYIP